MERCDPDDESSPESLADAFKQLFELQKEIDADARRMVQSVRALVDHRSEYQPTRASDYPDHDAAYYDGTARELAASGVRALGDFEESAFNRANPEKRSFVRMGLAEDGTIVALWFGLGESRALSLQSWLEDGRSIETTRTAYPTGLLSPPDVVAEIVDTDTPTRDVVRRHRSRVAAAGGIAKVFVGAQDLIAALLAHEEKVARFREQQGLALFEPMFRTLLGERYDEEGEPLVEAIQEHPEWWTGEEPADSAVPPGDEAPFTFLASRDQSGRGHLSTMGMMFRGFPELQMKAVAGNHWRAARLLMWVVGRKLVKDAVDPAAASGMELVLSRADVPQPNPWTSWGHYPEVDEPGEARVRLELEAVGGKPGLLGFLRSEAELLHLVPPAGYGGEKDTWLRQTCRRLGQDAPEAQGPEALQAAMDAASRRARQDLADFRERFRRGLPADQELVVKLALTTPDEMKEFVWVRVTAWDQEGVLGTLVTPPNHCPGYTAGQELRVAEADVFDRAIFRNSQGMVEVAVTDIVGQEFGVDI